MRLQMQVRDAIRPGGELRDIAHRRHAVRAHIGADVDPDVAAQAEDGAVAVERDLEIAFGLARMGDRHEMLAAVLDPFHRPAEFAGREGDQEILRIELAARAKAAADVVLDIVDRLFRQIHHRRHGAAVEERQLGRARHAEPSGRGVPFRQQAARLHGHRGHPLHAELLAAGIGGGAEGGVDIAGIGGEHGGAIACGAGDQQRLGAHRGVAVGQRRQMLDVEHHRLRAVLGLFRAVGENDRDRLADIAHHVIGQHRLRIGRDRRVGPPERDDRDRPPQILRGDEPHGRPAAANAAAVSTDRNRPCATRCARSRRATAPAARDRRHTGRARAGSADPRPARPGCR